LAGFAFALPSLEHGEAAFHSHTVGVLNEYQSAGIGYQLKLAQRKRALALGAKKMTWTFDPLRSPNAHLNFCKLGVTSDRYEIDFYGTRSSSPMHSNSTDRLWVTWNLTDLRVEQRLRGNAAFANQSQSTHPVAKSATWVGQPSVSVRSEMLDALTHLEPLVRFNGNGRPAVGELESALARQRIAIEIPGEMGRIERDEVTLAREWRLATRRAFTESLKAGFVVKEFCRSIRGQQGPGAYLLERNA
jgi:predicted GNAT superfamily acetyltransferase